MLRPLLLSALLACAAVPALVPTMAQADTLASTQVVYGDLNITSASDARILAKRLRAAATDVCLKANEGAPSNHYGDAVVQECVNRAINTAIASIQSNMERTVRLSLTSYAP